MTSWQWAEGSDDDARSALDCGGLPAQAGSTPLWNDVQGKAQGQG
jgi:hypothetical protein